MHYSQWIYGPLGSILGIVVGALLVIAFFEVLWRRETGKKWWWLKRRP